MTWRCITCGRAIHARPVTIPSRNGPLAFGPVCAKRAGLLITKQPRVPVAPVVRSLFGQLDIFQGENA